MAAKRKPGSELNHENWDVEEKPEDAGEFKKASEDTLGNRKIIRPKRRLAKADSTSSTNPFAAFSGFGSTTSNTTATATASPFANFSFPVLSPSSNSITSVAKLLPTSSSEGKQGKGDGMQSGNSASEDASALPSSTVEQLVTPITTDDNEARASQNLKPETTIPATEDSEASSRPIENEVLNAAKDLHTKTSPDMSQEPLEPKPEAENGAQVLGEQELKASDNVITDTHPTVTWSI